MSVVTALKKQQEMNEYQDLKLIAKTLLAVRMPAPAVTQKLMFSDGFVSIACS